MTHILPQPDEPATDVVEATRIIVAQVRLAAELAKLTAAGQMVVASMMVAAVVVAIYPPEQRDAAVDQIAKLAKENFMPARLH